MQPEKRHLPDILRPTELHDFSEFFERRAPRRRTGRWRKTGAALTAAALLLVVHQAGVVTAATPVVIV